MYMIHIDLGGLKQRQKTHLRKTNLLSVIEFLCFLKTPSSKERVEIICIHASLIHFKMPTKHLIL